MYCLEKFQRELAYFLDIDLRDLPKVQEILKAQGYTAVKKNDEIIELGGGVDNTKVLQINADEAITKLHSTQGQPIPQEIDIQTFKNVLESIENQDNFITHLQKKQDAQSRLAYLNLVEPTLKEWDIKLTKGDRKELIKVFNDGDNFFTLLITEQDNKRLITFIPKARDGYIESKIKNADLIQTFTSRASESKAEWTRVANSTTNNLKWQQDGNVLRSVVELDNGEKLLLSKDRLENIYIQSNHIEQVNSYDELILQESLEKFAKDELENKLAKQIESISQFGENYPQFYHKAHEAIQHLLHTKSGQVQGAFYRDEIGDITLAWGEKGTGKSDGWGLAKIVEYHPEVLDKLDELVQNLPIVKENANRYQLENDMYKLSIRKDFEGQKENWILTAFEKDESIARRRTDLPSSQSEAEKTTSANATDIIPQKSSKATSQISKEIKDIIDSSPQKGRDMQIIGEANFTPQVVEYAHKNNKKVAIDKLSQAEAEKLGYKYPNDVRVTIDYSAINHTLNRHGAESALVKNSGQKAVDYTDIAEYRNIVKGADESLDSVDNMGTPVVVSYKQINGHFVVVEEIRKGQNELNFKTMFKQEGNYKDSESYKKTSQSSNATEGYEPTANSFALTKKGYKPDLPTPNDIIPQNPTKAQSEYFNPFMNEYEKIKEIKKLHTQDDNLIRVMKVQGRNDYIEPLSNMSVSKEYLQKQTAQSLKEQITQAILGNQTQLKALQQGYNTYHLSPFQKEILESALDIANNPAKLKEYKLQGLQKQLNNLNNNEAYHIEKGREYDKSRYAKDREELEKEISALKGESSLDDLFKELESKINSLPEKQVDNALAFIDSYGVKYHIPKDTADLWLKTFNLKSLDEAYIPSFTPEVKQALDSILQGEQIKLTSGSLLKLMQRDRLEFLPYIKDTLESPQVVVRQVDGALIFAKDFRDDKLGKFFASVSKNDKGEWVISSNAPKNLNNLQNKIKEGGEVLYSDLPELPIIAKPDLTAKALNSEANLSDIIPQKSTKLQSNPHLGSGLVGGSVAGIEQDENGNITFSPEKFALGLLGGAAGSKAVMSGKYAIMRRMEVRNKDKKLYNVFRAIDSSAKYGSKMNLVGKENLNADTLAYALAKNKRFAINKLDEKTAKALGFKYPQDVRRTIQPDEIIHTLTRHGENSDLARLSGQKPVTLDEIAKYQDYADNAQVKQESKDKSNNRVLISVGQLDNGFLVVIEQIRKGQNELGYKNMYFEKGILNDETLTRIFKK